MTAKGVILYGPPAAGKDTITAELIRQDSRFTMLTKLKAGTGRSTGYRLISPEELDAYRAAGRLVVETSRYGNSYAVDRNDLEELASVGQVPIVHMGNLTDLRQLRSAVPLRWTTVLLWVPRQVCAERSELRGDADSPDRLRAWDETEAELHATDTAELFNLKVHTDQATPAETAARIVKAVKR